MKVLNVVLSVLILLLAAASAVFAFFLFEKREQMTEGWKKMASTIRTTAATLDQDSGTAIASELAVEKLSHTNYSGLPSLLQKLPQQAKDIVEERNALATAMVGIADTLKMKQTPTFAEVAGLESSVAAQQSIVDRVGQYKRQSDEINQMLAATAVKLNAKVTANELGSDNYKAAFDRFDQRVNDWDKQLKNFRSMTEKIATAVGASGVKADEQNYSAALDKTLQAGIALKRDFDSAISDIRSRDQKLAAAQDEIKGLNGTIENLNVEIRKKDDEIIRLVEVIDPASGGKKPEIWETGAVEARRALQGRVLDVNEKFGIITVDLGKSTRVKQLVGRNRIDVNPEIPDGATMVVVRDLTGEKPQYVGRIKLTRVEENCSIAELVSDTGKPVKVGDMVVFSDSDLASLMQDK